MDRRPTIPTEETPLILLVEDDVLAREVLLLRLRGQGYRTEAAGNGRVALERLAGGLRPNVILTDLIMPELDGFSLIEALRQLPGLAAIPVIVLTSLDRAAERERAAQLAVYCFLVKPARPDKILLALADALAASRTTASSSGSVYGDDGFPA